MENGHGGPKDRLAHNPSTAPAAARSVPLTAGPPIRAAWPARGGLTADKCTRTGWPAARSPSLRQEPPSSGLSLDL